MTTKPQKRTTLTDVLRLFPTDKECISYLENERWPDGKLYCIYCRSRATRTNDGYICTDRKTCKATFTIRTGTIYQDSPIPLHKWFQAIYHTTRSQGINSSQLGLELCVRQATGHRMIHKIFRLFAQRLPRNMWGVISLDEVYLGGLEKWKHEERKIKGTRGRSTKTKIPVLAIHHWSGFVMLIILKDVKKETLIPIIEKYIQKGSIVVTDHLKSYKWLKKRNYLHVALNHKKGEMSRGAFHNNYPENDFKHAQRFLQTFISVSPQYLQDYLNWFCFLFNYKKEDKFLIALRESAKVVLPIKPAKLKRFNNSMAKAA